LKNLTLYHTATSAPSSRPNDTTLCLKKNPCDYVFDDNLNSKRPILLIFGTVIT